MPSKLLNTLIGGLSLAAVAVSAPALSSTAEDCVAPSTEIVFVTVPASPLTVYITAPGSYAVVGLSDAPVTTITRVATLTSTRTALGHTTTAHAQSSPAAGQVSDPYANTITETAVATITDVSLVPTKPGGIVTYTETPAPNGILYYVVQNGTTYWLDGQTPDPIASYVYATSTATIVPVDPTAWSSEHTLSTLTLHHTIYSTQELTLTETLESATSTVRVGPFSSVSAGTGLPYMPTGGWNATKTSSNGGVFSGATGISGASSAAGVLATGSAAHALSASAGFVDPGTPTFIAYSTFDIYQTSHPAISISSFAAQSGFDGMSTSASSVFTAPASASTADSYANSSSAIISSQLVSAASAASGEFTTAVIIGQTVTWGGSFSTGLPYGNPSSITSSISDPESATPSSSGEFTTAVISGQTVTWGSTETTYTETFSTAVPYGNSTLVTSARVTSAATGIVTSLNPASSSFANGSSSVLANETSGLVSSSSTIMEPSSISSAARSSPVLSSSSSVAPLNPSSVASTSLALGASISSISSQSSSLISMASSTFVTSTSSLALSSSVASSSPLPPSLVSSSQSSTSISVSASVSVSSSASATPSTCGEQGNFLINFDDIPPLAFNGPPNDATPEPVFNPYHQFDFSDGFVVVPPPTDPYLPSSPPLLLEFIPNFNINGTNTQAGPNTAEEGYSGQISDGDVDQTGCFRFNFYGASFGCDSMGPPCDFTFTGYQLDTSRNEAQVSAQAISVPACPALANCSLTSVSVDNFENLAFVRINATVAGTPKIWWMDDLRLGWFDNSCAKGLCRQTTHLH